MTILSGPMVDGLYGSTEIIEQLAQQASGYFEETGGTVAVVYQQAKVNQIATNEGITEMGPISPRLLDPEWNAWLNGEI